MPWHLPQDLRFFKNTTWAMPVIMGRKTFDSLGKPLQGRPNFIITGQVEKTFPGATACHSLQEALAQAALLETKEIFIIGGGAIYREALPLCTRIYLTRVQTVVEDADTWFPFPLPDDWSMVWERPFFADDRHAWNYSFQCWEKQ